MDQFSGGNWTMIPNVQAHGNFPAPASQDHLFIQQQQQQLQQQQFHHQQTQFQPQDQQFQQFQHQQQQQYSQQQFHQQHRMLQSPPLPTQQLTPPLPTQQPTPPLQMQQPTPPLPMQQPTPPPQQPNRHHQSLASHFHLYPLVEKLADAIENGTRDQHSDALVTELNNHFEKCQQLLKSISGSISSKTMTVEGQKRKLEESEQLLDQRRDLIANYKRSVEDLVKDEP